MRKQELRVVITFHTTAEAIAMETASAKEGVPGRLIPVPRQLSAGCGLSWSMPAEWSGRIEEWLKEKGLSYEACGEYTI